MLIGTLDDLLVELRACRVCKDMPRKDRPLAHEPRPVIQASSTARLCIAGQAPGTLAHASGRAFTDPSGVRLREWIGLSEAQFYDAANVAIVPMGFCFPGQDAKGGDLPPRRECAPLWRARVFEGMPQVELILAIGQCAQEYHLGRRGGGGGLTELVQNWETIYAKGGTPRIIPLPHPSWRNNGWLKSNPWFERELLPFVRSQVARLVA
ncbi:MAG: uracil-DNA glycosylase family protein [Hyphomicrobiales bacterium]|nr:uracil-DNA glycosylase family protein [Hyphomicrobiales bacterium]